MTPHRSIALGQLSSIAAFALAAVATPSTASAQSAQSAVDESSSATPSGSDPDADVASSQDIVVIAAPAPRIKFDALPIATLVSPYIAPETLEQRLDRVAYFVSAAAGDRCPSPQMLTGLSLHDVAAYDASQRQLVQGHYRMGNGFGIRHIVPQSVAARAGFAPNDVITHVNGQPLSGFETRLIRNGASYDRTAQFETLLNAALSRGPATLTVKRGSRTISLLLPGEPGCGGKPVYYDRGGLNAWSDGRYIAVTQTMMKFAGTDDELAFVVAHEMAHNIQEHAVRLRGRSMLLASIGIGSGAVKKTEVEADQLGAQLMVSAGFSTDGALSVLQRIRAKLPVELGTTHPLVARRMAIVTEAARSIHYVGRSEQEKASVDAGLKDLALVARSMTVRVDLDIPALQPDQQPGSRLADLSTPPQPAPLAELSFTATAQKRLSKLTGVRLRFAG